ncbi:hypothetical protein [Clostridium felsineum]|uniref:hypothetical protein n=1 Tax=Clostridium felsineum TaxID=36839 RepID=UPI00098C8345|nr:hypothetical protein [Clostridium felsineum]URZ15449.1 hypothetical protein CLFE_014890 [Clostridium felsineum DSM 794]
MLDTKSMALIKSPAKTEEGKLKQKILCAYIDGFLDGASELSKHITSMYQNKNPNAHTVFTETADVNKIVDKKYEKFVKLLNSIE